MSFLKRLLGARARVPLALLLSLIAATSAAAQSAPVPRGSGAAAAIAIPLPVAPAVISRDEAGGATIRAVRLEQPLQIDGRLDEAIYQTVPSFDGFIQQEPHEGQPATERTDAWIFFDDRNVYVAIRCWYTGGARLIANEMQRDSHNIFTNDSITVVFDTYHDKRSGFFFQTNALGGIRDAHVTAEGRTNYDWNTVWDAKSRRFEAGWTTEMVIPFKSLRYDTRTTQVWGVNIRRAVRSKNEMLHITRIPASYAGNGVTKLSSAATLVGIETPHGSRNLEVKPYGIGQVTSNQEAKPPVAHDLSDRFGGDLKYGVTQSLTADVTYNTDFAQVEADEQQINLTRFNLQFPEKREFFLEGQGIFAFGGTGTNTPVLFFSRQIGLSNGVTVPIRVGGRLTGRAGKYSLGFLNIETEQSDPAQTPATNFSVARIRRDVFRRGLVGVMATRRAPATSGPVNQAFGADAQLRFFQDLEVDGYYAQTDHARPGNRGSYQGLVQYTPDRYGVILERLRVGESFDPQIGFLRRRNFTRDDAQLRFSPRPTFLPGVRKVTWLGEFERFADSDGRLETRNASGSFGLGFDNSDVATVEYTDNYELLKAPFAVAKGVVVPIGGYSIQQVQAIYTSGPQRRAAGTASVTSGGFYTGNRTTLDLSERVQIHPQLAVEPRVLVNWVRIPQGDFTTRLFGGRTTYTISPRAMLAALIQYNSTTNSLASNVRFRWEYRPGSDFFVVFTEGRDTTGLLPNTVLNRGVAVKYTHLFRF